MNASPRGMMGGFGYSGGVWTIPVAAVLRRRVLCPAQRIARLWTQADCGLASRLRTTMAAMACLSTASLALPRIASSVVCSTSTHDGGLQFCAPRLSASAKSLPRSVVLQAAVSSGVEPDLEEDNRDIHQTAGEDMEDMFPYGKADGAHTWHEGQDGTWWEGIKEVFETSGGPVGAQGAISWLFIPGLIAGVYFDVDHLYLFLYSALFIFAFIGMEMAKPSKPSHFEPEMYKLDE